jgi:hypothetical protein
MSKDQSDSPIEVEAVRLPRPDEPVGAAPGQRWLRALAPVLAGSFLDLVDFATRAPLLGLLLGSLAAWWVGGRLRLGLQARLWLTLGSAIYCAIGLRFVPLGTLLGILYRVDVDALRRPPRGQQ